MSEILEGPHAIAEGVDRLQNARLVAFPTETVYGLGADALCRQAIDGVFALKKRPATNPLIVHVSDIEMGKTITTDWTDQAQLLAEAFWPGPLTLVLPKAQCIPGNVTADGETVAIRCPAHPIALALIEAFARPIVGPSANPSGRISPTTPEHVADGFPSDDLLVIDGGHCRAGIESTVIDLTSNQPTILRPGIIGHLAIAEILGCEVGTATPTDSTSPATSPGCIGPHYQPRTKTKLIESDALIDADSSVVLIAWSITEHPADGQLILIPDQLEQFAANLYRTLHEADTFSAGAIWIESPPAASTPEEHAIREAIYERLSRATHS
ncbi:MAG: L-threonylcarbamoyladenylate synthase [Phycisphaerales bacterium]